MGKTIRIRQRETAEFKKGGMASGKDFATIQLRQGVHAVVGKLPGETKTTVQSLLFDEGAFDQGSAKKWCEKHGYNAGEFMASAASPEKGAYMFVDVLKPYTDGKGSPRARSEIAWTGRIYTEKYGWVDITPHMLESWAKRFEESRDQVPLDYAHGTGRPGATADQAKKAGDLEGLEIVRYSDQYMELWGDFGLNAKGAEYLGNGEFTSTSAEFWDDDKDQDTGESTGPILKAVSLTNRPVLRGQMPMAMLMSEDAERMLLESKEPGGDPAPVTEGNVGKKNLSEFGGPEEAECDQATADLVKKFSEELAAGKKALAEIQGKLTNAETAASNAAGESTKVVKLSEELAGVRKTLESVQTERKGEKLKLFFAENVKKVADAQKPDLEKLFLSGDDGEAICRNIVKNMPEIYTSERKSSGLDKPEMTASTRFLALVDDIQTKDKKTFEEALIIAGNKDKNLLAEYEREQNAKAGLMGGRGIGGEVVQ